MLRIEGKPPGMLSRLLSLVAGVAVLFLVFTLSLLLFVVLVAGGLLIWGFLWWKTRELRKQMREQMRQPPPDEAVSEGAVIEGEVIRISESDERDGH